MESSHLPVAAIEDADPPWGWAKEFRMAVYKPGTRDRRGGHWETVSHITLRRNDLSVYLVGVAEPVDPVELELEPTIFTTRRVPEPH